MPEGRGNCSGQNVHRNGFASLGESNLNLIEDFFSLFDENVRVYFCFESKTAYMIERLFKDCDNAWGIDADLMHYSITRFTIFLVDRLREFYFERIRQGMENIQLKRKEVCC